MAFSDFKNIADVQKKYLIKCKEDNFIVDQELSPQEVFLKDFEVSRENIDIFTSEASRSEIIISPLLREIYKNHYGMYSFWIQKNITFDQTLTGTPEYIFAEKSTLWKTVLEITNYYYRWSEKE